MLRHCAGPVLVYHALSESIGERETEQGGISDLFIHQAVPDPSHPNELHRDEQATKATVTNNAESH